MSSNNIEDIFLKKIAYLVKKFIGRIIHFEKDLVI